MQICFAYNQSGLRCMQPAGHDGSHAHAIEWTDSESWTPQFSPAVIDQQGPVAHYPQPVEAPVGSGRCDICEHDHHPNGRCGADEGEYTCDCMTSLEG